MAAAAACRPADGAVRGLLALIVACSVLNAACDEETVKTASSSRSAPVVHFNNPRLLPRDLHEEDEEEDDEFAFDVTQEDPDPLKLGGISIKNEAKKFALRFRKLSNEEIGVTEMQVGNAGPTNRREQY